MLPYVPYKNYSRTNILLKMNGAAEVSQVSVFLNGRTSRSVMRRAHVSPLAASRFAEDPLLYTTPYCHVKKGYPNTDGVNNVLSANRFAAQGLTWGMRCAGSIQTTGPTVGLLL